MLKWAKELIFLLGKNIGIIDMLTNEYDISEARAKTIFGRALRSLNKRKN